MKKLNNKGFSLVELIVVIAIMAILVGVLAPSVLGQLDKAKQSKDKQAMDSVAAAVAYAYADQDVTVNKPTTTGPVTLPFGWGATNVPDAGNAVTSDFQCVVLNMVGMSTVGLESNEFTGQTPVVNLNTTTGKVELTCTGASGVTYTVTK